VDVPCEIRISATGTAIRATLAAEGPIQISGAGGGAAERWPPPPPRLWANRGHRRPGRTGVGRRQHADAVTAADVHLTGGIDTPNGPVSLNGADTTLECGITADTINIRGPRTTITVTDRCRR
jgi:hypothetical protein